MKDERAFYRLRVLHLLATIFQKMVKIIGVAIPCQHIAGHFVDDGRSLLHIVELVFYAWPGTESEMRGARLVVLNKSNGPCRDTSREGTIC